MAFIQLNNISLSFGDRQLLEDITLNLSHESKTALAGGNGSGKSTLMRIIAGLANADSGEIIKDKSSRTAYLPQSGINLTGKTLMEDAETAFDYILPVLKEKEDIESQLAEMDEGSAGTAVKLDKLHVLQERINNSGYYARRETASVILSGLGFGEDDFNRPTDEFSGGWQMRIALARILLSNPDMMLLDEPTNYLDLEARNWLEGYLVTFSGGFVVVSHDRYFLDTTVNEIAELFNGRLKIYRGNYTSYEKKRDLELEQLVKDYNRQQEEISKLEDFINRFRYNASKAKIVQSRVKQLEKIEPIELPESMKKIHFNFPQPPHSGKQVLQIENLYKAYGENKVINRLDLQLEAGDKLVITGKNGAGKSTLMRIIAGVDDDYSGKIIYGAGVSFGYFSQDVDSVLNPERNVLEEIEADAPTHLIPNIRGMLGAFLFRGDEIYKSTAILSGGEKNRLSLLKLLLHPANLLILDEPTNHLDLQSKDVLLDALQAYEGTLLFVSHDRYFIDRLAGKVLEIEGGRHRLFPGNYEYYLWRKEQESRSFKTVDKEDGGRQPTEQKQTHVEAKKIKNRIRKMERDEEALLLRIEEIDGKLSEYQEKLYLPEIYSSPVKAEEMQKAIEAAETEQANLLESWEKLETEKIALAEDG